MPINAIGATSKSGAKISNKKPITTVPKQIASQLNSMEMATVQITSPTLMCASEATLPIPTTIYLDAFLPACGISIKDTLRVFESLIEPLRCFNSEAVTNNSSNEGVCDFFSSL